MYALHLFLNGKKGISGLQLMREIGVTYKTAWRMLRQIRAAMGKQVTRELFKGIVEMDETYVAGRERKMNNRVMEKRQKVAKRVLNKKGDKKLKGKTKLAIIGIVNRETKQVIARVMDATE
ncbi:MAG: IS1595 family transposase, partial [Cytophagales bacterium]|nr:IS1595 family transposase [Cytophagales bacterium]